MIENKFLDFEKPIAEIEARLDELNYLDDSEENISQEITKLEKQNFDVHSYSQRHIHNKATAAKQPALESRTPRITHPPPRRCMRRVDIARFLVYSSCPLG